LRGGRYIGTFRSSLTGTASAPIKVRQYPGERATLDGSAVTSLAAAMDATTARCPLATSLYAPNSVVQIDAEQIYLYGATLAPNRGWNGTTPAPHAAGAPVITNTVALAVDGAYTWFVGFEITNTGGVRASPVAGSLPPAGLGFAVDANGPGTKLINLVIHDAGQGIGLWTPATDAEAYGNVIYYNGWDGTDRGHGHGIYTQNQAPSVKRIADNVLFEQFAIGIQAYTESGAIDNIQLEGNVAFDNGALSRVSGYTYNLLVGGLRSATSPSLDSNFTYTRPEAGGADNLGYSAGCTYATVTRNYFAGSAAFQLVNCQMGLTLSGNAFLGRVTGFSPAQFPSNTYFDSRPGQTRVYIRPNQYETGRAHVIVYNWSLDPAATVDLTGILVPGDDYEVRNVRNLFGPPLLAGTYAGGALTVPLSAPSGARPVGATAASAPPEPEFAVFLVRKVVGALVKRNSPRGVSPLPRSP
jgi:hypothetical protein